MKIITTLIILILFPYFLNASDWRHIEELPGFVFSLDCPTTDCCFSLQNVGGQATTILLKSSNQGLTWDTTFINYGIWGGPFSDLLNPFATTVPTIKDYYIHYSEYDKDDILRSSDGGYNFERIRLGTGRKVFNLVMFDSQIGLADINNKFCLTFDAWQTVDTINYPHELIELDSVGNNLYNFYNLFFKDKDNVYMNISYVPTRSHERYLYNYNISSGKWEKLFKFEKDSAHHSFYSFRKYHFVNDTLGFIAASRRLNIGDRSQEIIFRTTNGGYHWEKVLDIGYTLPEWEWGLHDIDFYDDRNGVAAGKRGTVFFTNNGGDSWVHSEWHGKVFRKGSDDTYGPVVMFVQWAGQFPIIGTRMGGNMYRYEGDFFIFDFKAPDLFFPKQNTVKHEQNIQFRWEELRDATSYSFRLATDPDFNDILKEYTANEMNTNYDGLDYFTEYYWQVSSSNDEETMWSDTYTFRTKMPDVQTSEPLCYSEQYPRNLKFEWTAVKGAENYRLRLATNQNFTENLILIEDLEVPNYEIEVLESLTSYFWQVQAYRSDETGDWSELCSFTTTQDTVSVRDLSNAIKIFPNPTKDKIYIQTTIFLSHIELSDVLGNVVIRDLTPTLSKGEGVSLNVEGLPSGMYFLKLYTMNGEVLVEKVIVGF